MALGILDRLDQDQIDAFKYSMLAFNPAPPMPVWWDAKKDASTFRWRQPWRLRVRWWLEDFWRYTVKRDPRPVDFNFRHWIIGIDWGLEEYEPPAIDSRSWTGRY